MTLLEWGWMADRFKPLHITSAQFPVVIEIGGHVWMTYDDDGVWSESNIVIESLPKGDFADTSMWLGALMFELKAKLMSKLHKIKDDDLRDTVERALHLACRSTTSDYAICMAEALHCGSEMEDMSTIDAWMGDCVRDVPLGNELCSEGSICAPNIPDMLHKPVYGVSREPAI